MKKITVILFFLSFTFPNIYSQQFGNEWIDYSKQYFKMPISDTGIHRLDYITIRDALFGIGVQVTSIPTSQFQIFGREKEVPLYIEDGGDGFLNSGDYIEFFAKTNDSWLDSLVYDSANFVPDPYYSLFNDTIRYYLTWDANNTTSRMQIETDINYSAYTSENYCWRKEFVKFSSNYTLGSQENGISSPKYEKGEGWMGPNHTKGGSYTENIITSNKYSLSYDARCSMSIVSTNSSTTNSSGYNHNTVFKYGSTTVLDTSYLDYQLINNDFTIPISQLGSSTTPIVHSISNIGQGTDYQNVSHITLLYPHNYDFAGKSSFIFGIPYNNLLSKYRLSITNLSVANPILYVINQTEVKRIPVVSNSSIWECLVPNSIIGDSSICYISDSSNFIPISSLSPVNETSYFDDYSQYNLNDAFLIVTHKKLITEARNYASYRSNFYDTLVLDVEQLYDQFGGGVYKNPISIKRFIKFAMATYPTWPSHLFLIGKSVRPAPEYTLGSRNEQLDYALNLVPSWGYPTSDNHITVGLDNSSRGMAIPTGRRSATNISQVSSYLNKVQEYEIEQEPNSIYDLQNKEWQKNIIHFGGGFDSTEQVYINTWLKYFEDKIEDTLFGGFVHNFIKDPFSSSLNNNDFQKTKDLLQDGVSLITFFGHASTGTGFSQNIDSPSNWNNQGKYPLIIGLGCYTGDVHGSDTTGYAEELLLPSSEGGIGFISTVKQGFIPFINNYTDFLYLMMGNLGYGNTIGQQMKMTVDTLDLYTLGIPWGAKYESNYNGMSLQGDPALKINSHQAPEIVLDANRIWHEPNIIDLSVDTFKLYIVATNIGRAFDDSVNVLIEREFPDGQDSIYIKYINGLSYRDTIVFNIPTNSTIGQGVNVFNIKIDLPISFIAEQQDELSNNQISKEIFISSNALIPVWPYEYAIIGDKIDTLKASTMNPFEALKLYHFEIDTTDEFNSPFHKFQLINSEGGVIEAYPNSWINSNTQSADSLVFIDSAVYFWRCAPDSSILDWQERSFQYITDKWGWGQAHFHQFKENEYQGINYDKPNRIFDFQSTLNTISCNNFIQHVCLSSEWSGTFWKNNGIIGDLGGYIYPSIMIAVIDPITLNHWKTPFLDNNTNPPTYLNINNCFGQFNGDPNICPGTTLMTRNNPHGYFIFNYHDSLQMDALSYMLDSVIPQGHYILAYSYIPNLYGSWPLYNDPLYAAWPNSLFTSFQNLGATGFINQSQVDDGFIFFCQKGDLNSVQEIHSNPIMPNTPNAQSQFLQFSTVLNGPIDNGIIKSTIIGPAHKWNSLFWQQHALESNSQDSSRIIIYGITQGNNEIILLDTLFSLNDSINNLDNFIDANNYSRIRLSVFTEDLINVTPAQKERWQVLFDPVAELALAPNKGYHSNLEQGNLQQGSEAEIAIAIENISKFDMDSLLVEYEVNDVNSSYLLSYPRQDSLLAGEILYDTVKFTTNSLNGNSNIWITANPRVNGNIQDQTEQYYFNNIMQKNFNIEGDIINPILDVTFDGVHILNNDIVSPTPHILITLDDENPYLLLNEDSDTSNFQIFINIPNTNSWDRIFFSNSLGEEILKYKLADGTDNVFTIEYDPIFTVDGIYKLKVQGRDKTGNFSGDNDYQINFEVITRSTLTNFYNYPNPFSTKTHFVFTLTGSVMPDNIQIQIMTITGKMIRNIFLDEIGSIKIGHNKTEYYWDGKDEYGDQLANGIYLYKITARINGENIEHRPTSGDFSFTKGFGKMYLLK